MGMKMELSSDEGQLDNILKKEDQDETPPQDEELRQQIASARRLVANARAREKSTYAANATDEQKHFWNSEIWQQFRYTQDEKSGRKHGIADEEYKRQVTLAVEAEGA